MKIFKDKEQRNATLQSLGIHLLLTLLFIFFGLTYLDPKPEDGIAIAFGYDADGGGQTVEEPIREQAQTQTPTQSEPQTQEVVTEYTQESVDAPAVATKKKKEEKKPVEEKKEVEEKPTEEAPKEEKKPTIDDRLRNITSNPNPNQQGSGSGKTQGEGTQGSTDGSGSEGGAQGGGGIGESGNYRLGNRRALNKVTPQYDCNEEGRVVVQIRVNQDGKVVTATPGVNLKDIRSTTTSSCLLEDARRAAMATTWQSDRSAPDLQVGHIIYNYRKN